MVVSASIVLYKNDNSVLIKTLKSVLDTNALNFLILIDNSPDDSLRRVYEDPRIFYFSHRKNIGFGAGHNLAFDLAIEKESDYHFVINPDVYYSGNIIADMVLYMDSNSDVGMMMPQVLNYDSTVQYLPKLLPTPFSILLRKLRWPKGIYKDFIKQYELRDVPEHLMYNAPILSGCFTLFNMQAIEKVGYYDTRYFMYFEDWDLSRRIHVEYQTLYNPNFKVYHGYESGANRSFKLFRIFLKSAFSYFSKWGWFFDDQRGEINKGCLEQFQ